MRLGWDAYERSIHFDEADNWILDVAPSTPSHRQRKRVIVGHPWQSGPLELSFGNQSVRYRHSDQTPSSQNGTLSNPTPTLAPAPTQTLSRRAIATRTWTQRSLATVRRCRSSTFCSM